MDEVQRNVVYRNLANVASILGVLPMALLFMPDGYRFLIPFILYNNVMDDLDGVLAGKLKIRSLFGANLDNVCDTVVHVTVILLVSAQFGGFVLAAGVIAATAVIVRLTSRLDPEASKSNGSPTNELMRQLLFVLLLTNQFGVGPEIYLTILFLVHSVTMIAPFMMSFLIRGMARSATAVALVNVALIGAWLFPSFTPYIAAIFIASYFYSFATGSLAWLRRGNQPPA
ncbi:MAG: CDP-alcohol phosphatidyltransferase family protein [Verrucomicrobiales bacterium]|nr:CDP-alcohol phosphatidyltransferase family protein [Verrucomicrobiales bacterium]